MTIPNFGPEKLPHSVPKGSSGLVQEKVFSGKLKVEDLHPKFN
jgi:hypothetical protein